ncbi:MAG: 16S rRNA (guanine(966)-N(2))-methyltransferase RsmD [Cyanobium sp.]
MALRLSGGRRLHSPRGEVARPTTARVRAAVMNMLAADLQGCRWLELCGGSGVMACEALQRGAAAVMLVERDRRVAAVARENLRAVAAGVALQGGGPPPVVVEQEALRFLERGAAGSGLAPFDLIYADPPWQAGLHGPLAVAVAAGGWLAPGGTLVWECRRGTPLEPPAGWRERRRRGYGTSELVLLELEPPSAMA